MHAKSSFQMPRVSNRGCLLLCFTFCGCYFAKLNKHYSHHEERNSEVAISLSEIFSAYYNLYDLSLSSRYGRIKDIPRIAEVEDSIKNDLLKIVGYMKRLGLAC